MTRTASTAAVVPRAATAIALATLTLLGAASCTPKPAPTATPSSAPPASPTANAEEAQARDKALAAYNGYREAQVAAYAKADIAGTGLTDHVADPLLTQVKLTLLQMRQQGTVGKGRPTWSPKVIKVTATARPFTADIEDCFDNGTWDTVRKSDGKSVVAPGQATRYLVTAKAVQYDDGRWLIQQARADRDRPC